MAGRDLAEVSVDRLIVRPEFARAGVPLDLSFDLVGTPTTLRYEIAGRAFDCAPERTGDGRARCGHPGLDPDQGFVDGRAEVVVEARDADGRRARATAELDLDFTCPRVAALSLDRELATAGDAVTLRIELSEAVDTPPSVDRLGRDWGRPDGDGRSFSLVYTISREDPAAGGDVVVRAVDRAGNRSDACRGEGRAPLSIDHDAPIANLHDALLERDPHDAVAVLSAGPGAFLDDVGVDHVRVLDADGGPLAELIPEADGSLAPVALPTVPRGRVQLEAVDGFGRRSRARSARERWRVALGAGTTAQATARTGSRVSLPVPDTGALQLRTIELAPALAAEDTRSAVVSAAVGFEVVGSLPLSYEDANQLSAAYDPVGKAVVTVGGFRGNSFQSPRLFESWMDQVSVLRWDEATGRYRYEAERPLVETSTTVPSPLYGYELLAFGRDGCGWLNGGEPILNRYNELWRICGTPAGYRWTRAPLRATSWPLVYDPGRDRFLSVEGDGLRALTPADDAGPLRWEAVPSPTEYSRRGLQSAFYDPGLDGVTLGLWGDDFLTYADGRWTVTAVPRQQRLTYYGSLVYDPARSTLAVFGGAFDTRDEPYRELYLLTGTSTQPASRWRASSITPPRSRLFPSLVYDSDRELILMFGGVRPFDGRAIPPDVHGLQLGPTWPTLLLSADVVAARPDGIDGLRLTLRARGRGDGDGIGPRGLTAGGVEVHLWDRIAGRWDRHAADDGAPDGGFTTLEIHVAEAAHRYVSAEGAVPILVRSRWPATEDVDARLEVDRVDGHLELRATGDQP